MAGDRRSTSERRGDDRPDQAPRREQAARRNHDRRVIYTNAPSGDLTLLDGTRLLATLWDISQGGACVLVQGDVTHLNANDLCTLTLKEKGGREDLALKTKVAWSSFEDAGTYVGLKLRTGGKIPPGTFLDRLQRNR
ncbi:PilZ domain-containing protein [Vulcanococcus limneticus]|uniref:PilZ domain-containing protein n=1 Tax=Vulcanococcus limneticus TaxID=2170428 RepID=UPI00398BC3BC